MPSLRGRLGALLSPGSGTYSATRGGQLAPPGSFTAPSLPSEAERAAQRRRSEQDPPAGERQGLGVGAVRPQQKLPPATAQLTVSRARVDGPNGPVPIFSLRGNCCCRKFTSPIDLRYAEPPRISLGPLVTGKRGGESPVRTLYRMRGWSQPKYELIDWLRGILHHHRKDDDLRLIIWDESRFDIPWELFWLEPDEVAGQPGGWLGALATLTRWTTIHEKNDRKPYTSGRCAGDVLGYISAEMDVDRQLIESLSSGLADNFWELLNQLKSSGTDVALVYVASHGTFALTGFDFKIAEVSLGEIQVTKFSRIKASGGLVFVNACHSGRMIEDAEYQDGLARGFAEVFLRSGATAFIGTAGEIQEDVAAKVVEDLLGKLQDEPDRPVAVALRDYRRELAVTGDLPRLNDQKAAAALLRFVNAYMYLYFGGPDTTVVLPGAAP